MRCAKYNGATTVSLFIRYRSAITPEIKTAIFNCYPQFLIQYLKYVVNKKKRNKIRYYLHIKRASKL